MIEKNNVIVRYRLSGTIISAFLSMGFNLIFIDVLRGILSNAFNAEQQWFPFLFMLFMLSLGTWFLFLFIKKISFKVTVDEDKFFVRNIASFLRTKEFAFTDIERVEIGKFSDKDVTHLHVVVSGKKIMTLKNDMLCYEAFMIKWHNKNPMSLSNAIIDEEKV